MKKLSSFLLSLIIVITSIAPSFVYASTVAEISTASALRSALSSGSNSEYALTKNLEAYNLKVNENVTLDGAGFSITSFGEKADAFLCQQSYVSSTFKNLNIIGEKKPDVGVWLESGTMSFVYSSISNFTITSGRFSAIAMVGSTVLNLDNTVLSNNSDYDVLAYDTATININEGTELDSVHLASQFVTINIGDNWKGSFDITVDYPCQKEIGSVGDGADVSGIKLDNPNYYIDSVDGKLWIKRKGETSITFDMSKKEMLYKGSTGFLYGESEINVPTIDLLQGLKPDTMVQKAMDGYQHPTGDAMRTSSALLSAGVKDMQIYLQDHYLEWPYDAPMKNGQIDLDAYQKSVEEIIYKMICTKSTSTTAGAFKGSDGNYYVVNKAIADKYSFVLFNEPDQIWYGWNLTGLEQAWKRIYTAVHNIYPNARCVGPNFSGFNADSYDKFLKYCAENNCLPEIISWHELGDISLIEFNKHYDSVMADVKKYYPSDNQPQLMVNEYARHYDIGSAGGLVKWLSMFEDKDMSGCMAYWAMANSLNEMAADQNSPSSTWWVYHWYAQMTGNQCPLVSPNFEDTRFYGVSSYDEKENMAYFLFGGSEDRNNAEIVYANNIDKTNLLNSNNTVNVKIYGVGFSGQHGANYKPECIFDGAVKVNDGTLKIQLDTVDEMQAYFAIVTKADDSAEVKSFDSAKISTLSYEAENAKLLGTAQAYPKLGWATFATSNRADVGNILTNGSGVEFEVEVEKDGVYNAQLFYSLQAPWVNPKTLEPQENGQNRGIGKTLPFGVSVDGVKLPNLKLESTVVWWYKNHADFDVELTAGKHIITFTHINGDESQKGNLQLTAALDKLDLTKVDPDLRYDFSVDLSEMSNFKDGSGYRITAVAPKAGYYEIKTDGNASLSKQCVDYASDAKSYSKCSVYDVLVSNVVYLSQGANTIFVNGDCTKLDFVFADYSSKTVVTANDMTIHGNKPVYKTNKYANSGKVIAEIGVGQTKVESYKYNFVSFDVNANADGIYNLAIRYTNDEPAPVMQKANGDTYVHPYNIDLVERYAQIVVNDASPETVYFRNTMSWDSFKTVDVQVKLNKGNNKIKIYNDNSYHFSSLVNSTAPEIDEVAVSRLSYDGSAVSKVAKTTTARHTYSVTTVNPTCVKAGKKTYTCKICGYKKTETLSATGKHIYDSGKVTKKPTSSVAGVMTCTCKTCGKKKTSSIAKISKASISKLTAKSKGFTVSWKKVSSSTGYQIQYSTSSKFSSSKSVTISKNSTLSKSITKLKAKKKYYVRIRTYRTINGTKYYSSWSTSKSVTTK